MPLINTSVPNLIQGVSQQPDSTRFSGQCEEQENALSSVVDGLTKRPNTRHIARLLQSALATNSFTHFIERSDVERYVVIHDGSNLRAWNIITGTEATINGTTGGIPMSSTYLDVTQPSAVIKALSIADTTFLLNKSVTVSKSAELTDALEKQAAVTILQGDYNKNYKVDVVVSSTSDEPADPSYVAPQFLLTTTRYTYDTVVYEGDSEDGEPDEYEYYYRYRVTGITIVDGGAAVPDDFSISVTPSTTERSPASFSFTVVGGVVTGATVVNQGNYDGTGAKRLMVPNPNPDSGHIYEEVYWLPPTFTIIASSETNTVEASLSASITSGNSSGSTNTNANTDVIASSLTTELNNAGFGTYFNIQRNGNTILLLLTYTEADKEFDFTITTTDSLGGKAMSAVYKTTESISELPTLNLNGFRVKIQGDVESSQDDYYVKFETTNGASFGNGSYVEDVSPNTAKGVDNSTMPHSLVNTGLDTFSFGPTLFLDRVAGDDDSNPLPSFVNNQINSMFFFKNRLGFLSGSNVVMSESGLGALNDQGTFVYNLGRTSVASLLDSDPIDVSVSSRQVTDLFAAEGFQENLVLFADNGQFVLKGGDILTAKTINIAPITNFSVDTSVDPLPLGSYIYFPFTRGSFTGIREFTVNATTDTYDAVEITEHVPSYIPSNIRAFIGSTSEDMVAVLSNNERSSLYVYSYFWNNNQKVLSSWYKFTFSGEIRAASFVKSRLYLVVIENDETNLVEMPLEAGLKDEAGFTTFLDSRIEATFTAGSTTLTLPYSPADNSIQVYTKDGLKLTCSNVGDTVTLTQAVLEDTEVWVGVPYTMKYTFSEQLFKASVGNGSSPSNAAKLMIRNGSVYFDQTAYFQVKVTPKARDTYINTFTPDVVGASTIGSLNLDSGFFRFPVFTKAQDTTITIENDSALPSNFQNAEFESFLNSRSNRYG